MPNSTVRRLAVVSLTAVLSIGAAYAQTSAPVTPVPAFALQTQDGDNRLQIGLMLHFDGRFTVDDPRQDVTDTFLIRRARPIFQGRVARHFEYYAVFDLANPQIIRDAYLETRLGTAFRIRAGKNKVPFGLERLTLVNSILFVERALPSGLTPDRDTGVQVLGDLAGGRVSYAAAVMNGATDGMTTDIDTNDGKSLAGRVVVRPWTTTAMHPLAGLGVAIAGTTERQSLALPVYRSGGQQVFFAYAPSTLADGGRQRFTPGAFYYHGPFGGITEYIRSSGTFRRDLVSRTIDGTGWEASASWVVTGEAATDRGVRPRMNFDPPNHHYGALQVAARVHRLAFDREAIALGFAAPGSSRTASAFTVGANWYLNPYVKWVFNLERTVFDGNAGPRPAEHALLLRGQLSF